MRVPAQRHGIAGAGVQSVKNGPIVRLCGLDHRPVTLIEYFGGVDLGLDQLVMEHDITTKTSHPVGY